MPEICRFDPTDCQFPRPRVPLLPTLRWSDLRAGGAGSVPRALLEGPGARRFARGRYALRAACQAAGIGPDGALLAPSYHCRTMLDPALALDGSVRLYALQPDLTPDLASIEALVADSRTPAKALLLPHYFGIEQPAAVMQAVEALCRRHGLMLIEDCSHAWQVAHKRQAQGLAPGRAIVASPYKFFACPDGGMLWADPSQLPPPSGTRAGLATELKAAAAQLAPRAALAPAVAGSANSATPGTARGAERHEFSDRPSGHYDPALADQDCLRVTRWIMRHSSPAAITRQRQTRYRQWLAAVAPLRGARALVPVLPPDCAPYMFPLLISRPDPDFFLLKQAGLPIWRWDDMAVSNCAVATRYRSQLLHLPCHQSLSERQMDAMVATVTQVLA
jgi:perosamine synthetase